MKRRERVCLIGTRGEKKSPPPLVLVGTVSGVFHKIENCRGPKQLRSFISRGDSYPTCQLEESFIANYTLHDNLVK